MPDLSPLAEEGALTDLSGLPEAELEAEATRLTTLEARQRFDLERGPPLRARLLKLAPERHRLVLSVHHIVSDVQMTDLLLTALAQALARWTGHARSLVDLHDHGRDIVEGLDVSRTVGSSKFTAATRWRPWPGATSRS